VRSLGPISIDGLAERFPGGDSFRLNGETALDGFQVYSTRSSISSSSNSSHRRKARRVLGFHLLIPFAFCTNIGIHFFPVVVVVGKRCVDVCQGQVGILGNDLLWGHRLELVHDNDVLDLNAAPGHARFATACFRCADDVLANDGEYAHQRRVPGLARCWFHRNNHTGHGVKIPSVSAGLGL
jgi:hypothetical protein